ncbi:MAG: BolA/IbaG family iron-sulfur metabolism protein [Nitrosomonas sp.]
MPWRHRMVNEILTDELAQFVHALVLHTWAMEEWFERHGTRNDSPPCLGGGNPYNLGQQLFFLLWIASKCFLAAC